MRYQLARGNDAKGAADMDLRGDARVPTFFDVTVADNEAQNRICGCALSEPPYSPETADSPAPLDAFVWRILNRQDNG
jgi:hypothetical protein